MVYYKCSGIFLIMKYVLTRLTKHLADDLVFKETRSKNQDSRNEKVFRLFTPPSPANHNAPMFLPAVPLSV